jgi:hypothetical protein
MKPTLPPKYSIAPTWLLYHEELAKPVLVTALRVFSLGWRNHYERIAPIGLDELCKLCGLGRTQMLGHLSLLRAKGVLRYATTDGVVTVEFCRPTTTRSPSPENRTDGALHVVVSSSSSEPEQQQYSPPPTARESGKPDGDESGEPDGDLLAELSQILAPEVAQRLVARYSERIDEQLEHYDWALAQGRVLGVGWLVRAIEENWELPAEVQRRLEPEDGQRYVTGEFAEYIQH